MIQENLGHEDIMTTIGYIGKLCTFKNDQKLANIYSGLTETKPKEKKQLPQAA